SDCPGTDTECRTRTCSAYTCGYSFTSAGTPVNSQTSGDCKKNVCDGMGNIASVADNSDLPVDGNQCTDDVCSNGTPSNPFSHSASPCNQSGGSVCNGSGSCVVPPMVVSTSPADGSSVTAPTNISITFNHAMDITSMTTQTSGGACTGTIQVS